MRRSLVYQGFEGWQEVTEKELREIAEENRQQVMTDLTGMIEEIGQATYDATMIQGRDPFQGIMTQVCLESMADSISGLEINGKIRLLAIGTVAGIMSLRDMKGGKTDSKGSSRGKPATV